MEIFGHEYGLLYSVGAMEELKEHCPDHDLNKLGRLLDDAKGGKEMLCILSRWHEKAEAMKARLGGYLEALMAQDPAAVGGALPGDDFYYVK